MRNVISMAFTVMLVTFLFCACNAPVQPVPAAEATVPPVTMETEVLLFDGFVGIPQELVSAYDENGILTKTNKTEFHENGNISTLIEMHYDVSGNVTYYQEQLFRTDGSPAATLTKHFDDSGILTRQGDVSYRENEAVSRTETRTFSPEGRLLTLEMTGYFENGSPSEKYTESFDPETDLRMIRQEIYHISGQLISLRDGAFHPETYELLDGKIEEYSIDGPLLRTETAQWSEENRTLYRDYYCYGDNSSGRIVSCFNSAGQLLGRESHIYEEDQILFEHFIEKYTYDRKGNLTAQEIQYYLDGGFPAERFEKAYEYDAVGNLLRLETAHYLATGKRQNFTVTEYIYDGIVLSKEVQTSYDQDNICKSSVTKTFDIYGVVTNFTTLSSSGNTYDYAYTYDEEGRVASELMTTRYKSAPRIDYRETAYEYHENGRHSSVTVHQWTSYDEAKFPYKEKSALGTTTVTKYDENGNKIKK